MIRPTKPKAEKTPKTPKTSLGERATKAAQATANSLNTTANTIAQTRSNITNNVQAVTSNIAAVTGGIGAVAGAITTGRAQVAGAAIDAQQATATNYGAGQHRSEIIKETDFYGGITMPEMDFNGLIPSDLLNPNIAVTATEEQLTAGLENYAGAIRAQKLYQQGYNYIGELGKTKQAMHKAQQEIIKGATQGVKVQQEIVRFDRQNIELETDIIKREQSAEKLNQESIKLTGMQKETTQLTLKIEAVEAMRDADILSMQQKRQMILQKLAVDIIAN
ncbi:hypothetical protein QUA27_25625 [Microcoleus sp. Pol14C6]|uniref:hypothetical protein n=1 Tax=unclassified Microcoleus TaxID=2642155 RepID=UPI002FD3F5C2